jgi:hypothetical protein
MPLENDPHIAISVGNCNQAYHGESDRYEMRGNVGAIIAGAVRKQVKRATFYQSVVVLPR